MNEIAQEGRCTRRGPGFYDLGPCFQSWCVDPNGRLPAESYTQLKNIVLF